ncbi:MAG TPA: hypothetical protein VLH60_00560 [Sedimentisphaerales bacterium]|nr:hypothetical protein [Sedimentisphaerales bacterium]
MSPLLKIAKSLSGKDLQAAENLVDTKMDRNCTGLRQVIEAWEGLPEHIKAAIVHLANHCGGAAK